jgi:hypothetical protein
MNTFADLKQHLEQFDDDAMIVFRADTDRIRLKAFVWKENCHEATED